MQNTSNFVFFDQAEVPDTSKVLVNHHADSFTVQVSGEFDSVEIEVQGICDLTNDTIDDDSMYHALSAIDLTELTVEKKITKTGIYTMMGGAGCKGFRVKLNSVEGGSVTVFGKLVNCAGGS